MTNESGPSPGATLDLCAVLDEARRWLRQREAQARLLTRFGEDANVSQQEADAIRAEWQA